eukprot:CAMPEP_0170422608 /NCGR_PEP_ID=MMETSP0117_2-20130122/36546_1 /TAXON_ID=400756 /ORGANISM="Durinskia baltica, Strain CSIRO CS-38" /LENGTH=79 /DNA_ID=CAMNT_0010681283 /DNA_START=304 /DNA_END=540 /DNA_ORIENTATION=+
MMKEEDIGRSGCHQRSQPSRTMHSGTPQEPVSKELDLGGSSKISFKTMPSNEFHKRSSLIKRLWLAINHRWMSYHLVEQ